jgi:hypothetical protein
MSTSAPLLAEAPAEASALGRFDGFHNIHKALRAAMAQVLVKAGAVDVADPADVAATAAAVRDLLTVCAAHLAKEDAFIQPAMEARRPGSARERAAEHRHHETAFGHLRDLVEGFEGRPAPATAALLYRGLAVFMADNLLHMEQEESHDNSVLWDAYTDAELMEIEGRLVASLKPEELAAAFRVMIPALAPAERTEFLAGIRAKAPAPVFEGLLGLACSVLPGPAAARLRAELAA